VKERGRGETFSKTHQRASWGAGREHGVSEDARRVDWGEGRKRDEGRVFFPHTINSKPQLPFFSLHGFPHPNLTFLKARGKS
jgi:hypothetical protein